MTIRDTILLLQQASNLDVELLTIINGRALPLNTLADAKKGQEAFYDDENQELKELKGNCIFNGEYTQNVCILYHQPFYDYDH